MGGGVGLDQLKVKSPGRVQPPSDPDHMVSDTVAITHFTVLSPGNSMNRAGTTTGGI